MKSYTLRIDLPDDWQEDVKTGERGRREQLLRAIQDAFDHYWKYLPMGTVKAVVLTELREPTESERVGPLG